MAWSVRNRSSNAELRHKGVLSFFCFFEFENSSEDFPEIGNGFPTEVAGIHHPHIFTGRKNFSPIEYEGAKYIHRDVKCRFTT